jgi:hypothetical protein
MKMKRQKQEAVRITRVAFRSNVQIGSFQTAHVEAEAFVQPGQDPSAVLAGLKTFVANELAVAKAGREELRPVRVGGFRDEIQRRSELQRG